MGNCRSALASDNFILHEISDGGEEEFHARFCEDEKLGEGEFAKVRQVCDVRQEPKEALACKYLKKGATFKDNTLYPPIKPEVLLAEVEILKTLKGNHYCLELRALYESPKQIYVVTELCTGGELPEWVSKQKQDLRTEDVSRIAYQLLSAVNHCAQHNIIHRDIKPENILFQNPDAGAELRLIDFGSGTNRPPSGKDPKNPNHHTTFAGSGFYISPEMFQKTYTFKTDVWSVGATLYVLVAGYPADCLQKAFNLMHKSKDRDLRQLPNLPAEGEDMPTSFYGLLDNLLTVRHRQRKSAAELLPHDFVQFHLDLHKNLEDHYASEEKEDGSISFEQVARKASSGSQLRESSTFLSGSVQRHVAFLDYQRFQRSMTTLLATLLSRNEFEQLVTVVKDRCSMKEEEESDANASANSNNENSSQVMTDEESTVNLSRHSNHTSLASEEKMRVLSVKDIKSILKSDIKNEKIIYMIQKLKGAEYYDGFAYEVGLIRDFSREEKRSKGISRHRSMKTGGGGSSSIRSLDGSLRGRFKANLRGVILGNGRSVDGSLRAGKFRGRTSAVGNKSVDSSLRDKMRASKKAKSIGITMQ